MVGGWLCARCGAGDGVVLLLLGGMCLAVVQRLLANRRPRLAQQRQSSLRRTPTLATYPNAIDAGINTMPYHTILLPIHPSIQC